MQGLAFPGRRTDSIVGAIEAAIHSVDANNDISTVPSGTRDSSYTCPAFRFAPCRANGNRASGASLVRKLQPRCERISRGAVTLLRPARSATENFTAKAREICSLCRGRSRELQRPSGYHTNSQGSRLHRAEANGRRAQTGLSVLLKAALPNLQRGRFRAGNRRRFCRPRLAA